VNPVVLNDAHMTCTDAGLDDVTVMSAGGIQTTSSRRFASGSLMLGHDGVSRLAPEPADRAQFSVDTLADDVPPVMNTSANTEYVPAGRLSCANVWVSLAVKAVAGPVLK
jgi:hypothetical protein